MLRNLIYRCRALFQSHETFVHIYKPWFATPLCEQRGNASNTFLGIEWRSGGASAPVLTILVSSALMQNWNRTSMVSVLPIGMCWRVVEPWKIYITNIIVAVIGLVESVAAGQWWFYCVSSDLKHTFWSSTRVEKRFWGVGQTVRGPVKSLMGSMTRRLAIGIIC